MLARALSPDPCFAPLGTCPMANLEGWNSINLPCIDPATPNKRPSPASKHATSIARRPLSPPRPSPCPSTLRPHPAYTNSEGHSRLLRSRTRYVCCRLPRFTREKGPASAATAAAASLPRPRRTRPRPRRDSCALGSKKADTACALAENDATDPSNTTRSTWPT